MGLEVYWVMIVGSEHYSYSNPDFSQRVVGPFMRFRLEKSGSFIRSSREL